MRLWLVASVLLAGCTAVRDFHAVSARIGTCEVISPDQIEAADVRTGYPLLSAPHRYSCYLNDSGKVTWVVENSSEASLEGIIDNPIGAAIQKGIPAATWAP